MEHCVHYELWTLFEGGKAVGVGEGEVCCQCDTVIEEEDLSQCGE